MDCSPVDGAGGLFLTCAPRLPDNGIDTPSSYDFANFVQVVKNLPGNAVVGKSATKEAILAQRTSPPASDLLNVGVRAELALEVSV